MPSWEIFEEQGPAYRDEVLPPTVAARLSIEAGATLGWKRYVGDRGDSVGLDRFGASAPGEVVLSKVGFNVENVVAKAKALLGGDELAVGCDQRIPLRARSGDASELGPSVETRTNSTERSTIRLRPRGGRGCEVGGVRRAVIAGAGWGRPWRQARSRESGRRCATTLFPPGRE